MADAVMSTKTCPLCGEDIQTAAVLCRYCGASFVGPGGAASPGVMTVGTPHPVPVSGMAITAFIFSLLWLGGVGAIVGLVLGYSSRASVRAGYTFGEGFAVAAIVLGWIGVVALAFWIVYFWIQATY